MDITEVRVKLVEGKQDKLKAFCSITIDNSFVVRDLKVIEGAKGLFVAMPSRKITVRCDKCGAKNQIGGRYCSNCSSALPADRGARGRDGRLKLHADIAHPINSECRESIQTRVLESFEEEFAASSEPGYQPASFEDLDVEVVDYEEPAAALPTSNVSMKREDRRFGGDDDEEQPLGQDRGAGRRREGRPGRDDTSHRDDTNHRADKNQEAEPERRSRFRGDHIESDRPERGDRDNTRAEGKSRGRSERGRRNERGSRNDRGNRNERGNRGEQGQRSDRDRRDRPSRDRSERRERSDRRRDGGDRNAAPPKENRFPREKTVETSNPPPDDNFGVGIF
ncbi:MAG: septation protein SpoVG family protein [Planctomycetota bacterium]